MQDMPNEVIRRALTRRAGDMPDAGVIAEAALYTWGRISSRLEPVIGLRGVDALFNRAVHVTGKTYPWLTLIGVEEDGTTQLAVLRARLSGREPAEAEESSYVLLMTFTTLLGNLIGESLTRRLLEPVWSAPSASPEVKER